MNMKFSSDRSHFITMFNASIFEKIVLGTAITSTAAFIIYTMFKQPNVKKEDAFKIRQDLL